METFYEKIRELREEQGITREEFCGDESELSVRQLARIEKGDSIPSLSKAYYIAEVLGVSLDSLVSRESFELPERYKELKNKLLRTSTYSDPKRITLRESMFDEISDKYYDSLPEEERLAIDCLQSKLDVFVSQDAVYGSSILEEYFEQIFQKSQFSLNDLIFIDHYIMCFIVSDDDNPHYDLVHFESLVDKLLKFNPNFSDVKFQLVQVLTNCLYPLINLDSQERAEKAIKKSSHLMNDMHDYHRSPILNLLEWKYYLKFTDNIEKAKENFNKALGFARIIGDDILIQRITEEWRNDTI